MYSVDWRVCWVLFAFCEASMPGPTGTEMCQQNFKTLSCPQHTITFHLLTDTELSWLQCPQKTASKMCLSLEVALPREIAKGKITWASKRKSSLWMNSGTFYKLL